jgi:hypothetical protein
VPGATVVLSIAPDRPGISAHVLTIWINAWAAATAATAATQIVLAFQPE